MQHIMMILSVFISFNGWSKAPNNCLQRYKAALILFPESKWGGVTGQFLLKLHSMIQIKVNCAPQSKDNVVPLSVLMSFEKIQAQKCPGSNGSWMFNKSCKVESKYRFLLRFFRDRESQYTVQTLECQIVLAVIRAATLMASLRGMLNNIGSTVPPFKISVCLFFLWTLQLFLEQEILNRDVYVNRMEGISWDTSSFCLCF